MRHALLGIVALLALTGCATKYQRPQTNLPAQFAHGPSESAAPKVSDRWWQAFNDPHLNSLIDAVVARNNDLAVAALRVRQAQYRAGIAGLDQLPSASGSISANKDGNTPTNYSARISIAYEVDLWGRLNSLGRAADWELRATAQDRDAAQLALIGTACELYWRIGFTHQQITTGEASLAYARKLLDLVRVQHRAGAVSGVEESEAEQSVNSQIASLTRLQQQLVEYRASLALLMNGEPTAEATEPQALPDMPLPDVDPGLPAELLARRPDLQAAESRLREQLAITDATRAGFYPALSLTAGGGGSSTELGTILAHASTSLGAALSLPFLDFPRNHLNKRLSERDYDIAVLTYKQTLLQALADTDNTLSNRTQLARQGDALRDTLTDAERTESLYGVRYRAGAVALRVLLDAQESRRSAQLSYDSNRLDQLINQATLYQALGGGY